MLGFGAIGQYALGQVGVPSSSIVGVYGTGAVGTLSARTGNVPAVYGTGAVGTMMPSTLQVNERRLLANELRRLRTLGTQEPSP